MALSARRARQGGGKTTRSHESVKSMQSESFSVASARQLFSSRHGAAEALGGAKVNHTDLTKKHVYEEGEAKAGFRFYEKEVEQTQMQSRAMSEASLYADKSLITPTWLKVSESPFTAAAKASGGYGRRMDDTTVSHDAPDFFHIPQVMDHDPKIAMSGSITKLAKGKEGIVRDDTTISEDVPDWMKIRAVVEFSDSLKTLENAPHKILIIGKQVLCEPFIEDEEQVPIDWDQVDEEAASMGRTPHPQGGNQTDSARPEVPETTMASSARRVLRPPGSARLFSSRSQGRLGSSARGGGDGGTGGATTARLAQGAMGSGRPALAMSSSRDRLFTPTPRG